MYEYNSIQTIKVLLNNLFDRFILDTVTFLHFIFYVFISKQKEQVCIKQTVVISL